MHKYGFKCPPDILPRLGVWPDKLVAAEAIVPIQVARDWRVNRQLPPVSPFSPPWDREITKKFVSLYNQPSVPIKKIADIFGIPDVKRHAQKLANEGWPISRATFSNSRGTRHFINKVFPSEISELRSAGHSIEEIARLTNLSPYMVDKRLRKLG